MIIPRFWAEARAQHREKGRQVTVRRLGWSTQSQTDAQAMAEARVTEALQRTLAGEELVRREPKVAYNGAEGVPIREEIIAEHGDCVITRNSYGALCLNTPDVLFADVDFLPPRAPHQWEVGGLPLWLYWVIPAIVIGGGFRSFRLGLLVFSTGVLHGIWIAKRSSVPQPTLPAEVETRARKHLSEFVHSHPTWKLRLYRTPAGLRVLAMHRPFAPDDPEVADFFHALKCDPVYVQMCQRQQCFRARVSPKPWRIGISDHLRPRPGVWPVREEAMPVRRAWVDAYHAKATGFAACRFEAELGQGAVHEKVRAVQQLHDQLCRADSGLPIA